MRKFWCVTSSYDDKGTVTANITATTESEYCPKSSFCYTRNKVIYKDWFDSEEAATEFFITIGLTRRKRQLSL